MLSNRLSLLVKAKGLTRKSIADKMGVSEQALNRYLHGKTAISAKTKLACGTSRGTGLESDDLVLEDERRSCCS